jgi:hypothetical protein
MASLNQLVSLTGQAASQQCSVGLSLLPSSVCLSDLQLFFWLPSSSLLPAQNETVSLLWQSFTMSSHEHPFFPGTPFCCRGRDILWLLAFATLALEITGIDQAHR